MAQWEEALAHAELMASDSSSDPTGGKWELIQELPSEPPTQV